MVSFDPSTSGNIPGNRGRWIRMKPSLFIADVNNNLITDISSSVISGSVSANEDNEGAKITAQINVNNPALVSSMRDYLAPFLRIEYADGSVADDGSGYGIQCGLYATVPANKTITPQQTVGTFDARDLTYQLGMRAYSSPQAVASGTNVVTEIVARLAANGFTRYNIPNEGRVLNKRRQWPSGTPVITVINDLLKAIRYYAIWCDRFGQFATFKYLNFKHAEPASVYFGGQDGSALTPFDTSPDISGLFNHLIVYHEDKDTPIKVVRKNTNLASPFNIYNPPVGIGLRSRVEKELAQDLTTTADVNELADRLQQEWGSVAVSATFSTFPEPWHGLHEIYEIHLTDINGDVIPEADGRFWCKGWQLGFTRDAATMTHNLYRVDLYNSDVT